MPRRIIISVTNDLSTDQRVHRIATTLSENGWKVTVVGRVLPTSPDLPARIYQTRRLKLSVTKGKWFYIWFNFRLFFYLLFKKSDILYANDLDTLFPNWMVARLRRKKLIYDSHELWTEVPELTGRPRTRWVWLKLEQFLFPKVDLAFTVNQSIAEIYSKLYGIEVIPIRNLPFRQPEQPSKTEIGTLLWYQGALNEGRGLELMIGAMEFLPREYRLEVAGSGPLEKDLEALIVQKKLGGRVKLLGHVGFEELARMTPRASLGMSLEEAYSRSYQLATPNKLFDYIQAGLPVLVSSLPEMQKIVEKAQIGEVLLEEDRTPERLAHKVTALLSKHEQWLAFEANARKYSHELCWENESLMFLSAIKKLS